MRRSLPLLTMSLLAAATLACAGVASATVMSSTPGLAPRGSIVAVRYDTSGHRHDRKRHGRHFGVPRAHYRGTVDGSTGFAVPRPAGRGDGRFHINRYGYGNYTFGPHGRYGGYPPGSAGYKELLNNQRYKCNAAPQSC